MLHIDCTFVAYLERAVLGGDSARRHNIDQMFSYNTKACIYTCTLIYMYIHVHVHCVYTCTCIHVYSIDSLIWCMYSMSQNVNISTLPYLYPTFTCNLDVIVE